MNDKKLAIVTPLILLLIVVTFSQVQIVPQWLVIQQTGPAVANTKSGTLQVLGYNYNRDLVQISVTLWNRGSAQINITGVSYDGLALKRGTVGSPNDLLNGSATLTPNDIIFAATDHWNMYTQGPTVPLMRPNGIATLYLGVSSTTPGLTHTLVVISGVQQYVFELER